MADVPNVAGVPALVDYATSAVEDLLTTNLVTDYATGQAPQWGIYLNGSPIIVAESVVAFDFRDESSIANYPVERGGFESYNKVKVPFLAKVRFASGNDDATRASLLNSISTAKEMLIGGKPAKFDVVTPEVIYSSASIAHYDYNREAARGLGLLIIDVWVQEVREQNTGQTDSSSVSGTSTQDGGTVQSEAIDGSTAVGQGGIGHA